MDNAITWIGKLLGDNFAYLFKAIINNKDGLYYIYLAWAIFLIAIAVVKYLKRKRQEKLEIEYLKAQEEREINMIAEGMRRSRITAGGININGSFNQVGFGNQQDFSNFSHEKVKI